LRIAEWNSRIVPRQRFGYPHEPIPTANVVLLSDPQSAIGKRRHGLNFARILLFFGVPLSLQQFTVTKSPANIFDGCAVDVQLLVSEVQSFPFDPDSDPDSDPDQKESDHIKS
jgi:hypothetical protein